MLTSAVVASRRRILRFFGPRGDLLAAESPGLVIYDSSGRERVRVEIEFVDIACVGDELWIVTSDRLVRLATKDGRELGREALEYLDRAGHFLQSSTAPQ